MMMCLPINYCEYIFFMKWHCPIWQIRSQNQQCFLLNYFANKWFWYMLANQMTVFQNVEDISQDTISLQRLIPKSFYWHSLALLNLWLDPLIDITKSGSWIYFLHSNWRNHNPCSVTHWAKWCIYTSENKPSMVQLIACHVFYDKPLSQLMLAHH